MSFFDLAPEAKCWIYQSDRALNATEKEWLNEQLDRFVAEWAAHGSKLLAQGKIIGDYHVVLAVDESQAGASGCSIDASVRFIKSVAGELQVDFFNRMKLLVENDAQQQLVPFSEISNYPESTVYNNLVPTVGELETKWKVKVSESPFFK